jgi:hypothetical protein
MLNQPCISRKSSKDIPVGTFSISKGKNMQKRIYSIGSIASFWGYLLFLIVSVHRPSTNIFKICLVNDFALSMQSGEMIFLVDAFEK